MAEQEKEAENTARTAERVPPADPSASPKPKAGEDKLHVETVRELIDLMVTNELSTLEIVNGDLKIALGRPLSSVPEAPAAAPATPPPAAAPAAGATGEEPAAPTEEFIEIKSPMVGTYYAASSPDSEPFVSTGDRVSQDTVVCLVEAMKVMNEIKAECSGTIVDIAAINSQPVEYGQVLFHVKP